MFGRDSKLLLNVSVEIFQYDPTLECHSLTHLLFAI